MSIRLMSEVWKLDLPQRLLILLLALSDFGKDDGTSIYPSKRLLSWKTGYSVRQIQRLMRLLENEGILKVHKCATNLFPTVYVMDLRKFRRKDDFTAVKKIISIEVKNVKKVR